MALTLSRWNQKVTITPPTAAQVIDLSAVSPAGAVPSDLTDQLSGYTG